MGFFDMEKNLCDICGESVGKDGMRKVRLQDGTICGTCWVQAGGLKIGREKARQITVEDLRPRVETFLARRDARLNLPADVVIGELHISTQEKKWYSLYALFDCDRNAGDPETALDLFDFDDVEKIWAETDGQLVTSTTIKSNGVGRAIVGGVLAGSTGAILGAATAVPKVSAQTSAQKFYRVYMHLKPYPGRTWLFIIYSSADLEKVLHMFDRPASSPAPRQGEETGFDPAVELRKYKALLDDGIITQEDFDAKKKQLLQL